MDANLTALNGAVERVIYKNPSNGYIVLELALENNGGLVIVVGNLGDIGDGEKLSVTGSYIESPKYGKQFKAQTCERMPPSTA